KSVFESRPSFKLRVTGDQVSVRAPSLSSLEYRRRSASTWTRPASTVYGLSVRSGRSAERYRASAGARYAMENATVRAIVRFIKLAIPNFLCLCQAALTSDPMARRVSKLGDQ